jgi:hypothetical protein
MVYQNTFIQVAPDSEAKEGIIPNASQKTVTIHSIEYQLLTQNPYQFNHEELIFAVYIIRQGITDAELSAHEDEIRAELFQKEHPCLRASALTKRYGWGAHYNEHGKIALYAVNSVEYQQLANDCPKQLLAMRSKRNK